LDGRGAPSLAVLEHAPHAVASVSVTTPNPSNPRPRRRTLVELLKKGRARIFTAGRLELQGSVKFGA
jgi:hypothetical protein